MRYAWDPAAPAASALRTISSTGQIANLPTADLVAGDPTQTELQIFGTRHVGIAANASVPVDVPAFARATTTFPHGFEVKCDGDGSGGLLLIRLVGATPTGERRQVAAAEATRQIAFRQE